MLKILLKNELTVSDIGSMNKRNTVDTGEGFGDEKSLVERVERINPRKAEPVSPINTDAGFEL